MQAILWLNTPLKINNTASAIIVADLIEHDPSEKSAVININGGFRLYTKYDHCLLSDSCIGDAMWLFNDQNGNISQEVADIRLPAP